MEIDELGAAAKMDQLPFEIRWPTERALALWRSGDLDAAKSSLDIALASSEESANEFGMFHALHLRACVAFSERDYRLARQLHTEVLVRCRAIDFLGGIASSLCDLAMIDLAEGDVDAACVRYERGLACYEDGGYHEQAAAARAMWDRAAHASSSRVRPG
jgi:hypothetical protein